MREASRGRACLLAPFDALRTLRSRDRETVRSAVAEIVLRNAAGGGFILSTGCPILKDVPLENLDEMVQTAKTLGIYPLRHRS